MSRPDVYITSLRGGFYLVTVGTISRVCISLVQAGEWAEKQLEKLRDPSSAPPDEQ